MEIRKNLPINFTIQYSVNVLYALNSMFFNHHAAGIANALDLTDRILPRLTSHTHCKPRLLHFPPYTREEIVTILKARVGGREEGEGVIVDSAAIEFCARKVSSVHGDLRKALDICRYIHYHLTTTDTAFTFGGRSSYHCKMFMNEVTYQTDFLTKCILLSVRCLYVNVYMM